MSKLTPKNLNSTSVIPDGSLVEKEDADLFKDGGTAGGVREVFTVIAGLSFNYISLLTERFTGSGSGVNVFPKSFVVEQPGVLTVTLETNTGGSNFFDLTVNGTPDGIVGVSDPGAVYATYSGNITVVAGDVVGFQTTKSTIGPVFGLKNVVVTYDKNVIGYTSVEPASSPVD